VFSTILISEAMRWQDRREEEGKPVYMAKAKIPSLVSCGKGSTVKHGTMAYQGSVCASAIFNSFFPVIM
jgi:hypothetical protein